MRPFEKHGLGFRISLESPTIWNRMESVVWSRLHSGFLRILPTISYPQMFFMSSRFREWNSRIVFNNLSEFRWNSFPKITEFPFPSVRVLDGENGTCVCNFVFGMEAEVAHKEMK